MALNSLAKLGIGGTGMSGQADDSVIAALKELQGLNITLLAGAAANTKINVAALRQEDTIVVALNNNAGTLTDITANVTIEDVRAAGTVTVSGAVTAGETVTVNGKVYTAAAAPVGFTQFAAGATVATVAASLAAAINAREANALNEVVASANAGVVTVHAVAEGTGGNAITLAETGVNVAVSGATLAGGTATGGIKSTSITNAVLLFWFNKK